MPLSEVRSAAPDGEHGAADYALPPHAHVQVWSRGAFQDDSQGKKETVVHVGFVLDNQGPTPLRLDEKRLFLEDIGSTEGSIEKLAPAQIDGNTTVAPSGKAQIEVYFALPQRIWPSDIVGYRVVWALDGEKTELQHTAFESTRFGPRVYLAYYPYYPYYPWGWYYPWRPYPYYAPYPYWGPVYGPRVYVTPRVYGGPRYLARPRAR